MRFVCDGCQAKYSIADDRVENKVVKLNCQKCGHEITVRGPVTKPAAPEAKKAGPATMAGIQPIARQQVPAAFDDFGDEENEPKESTRIASLSELDRMRIQAMAEAGQPTKKAAPPPAPPPAPKEQGEWLVLINNEQRGPFSVSQIKDKIAQGDVNARTYVWREGMGDWVRVAAIAELNALLPKQAEAQKPDALAVADLVDPRIQNANEKTKPAFDMRAAGIQQKKKIEPSGDFDDLFGPGTNSAPFDPPPQQPPESSPQPEHTRAVIAAAGLVGRRKKQRMYVAAAVGSVSLLVLLLLLDLTGVITIPAFGAAYDLVGIDNPHSDAAPQYSDNLTEEERRRIREGLMGKKPASEPVAPQPKKEAKATPDEKPEPEKDKQLSDIYGDTSRSAVTLETPKLKTPPQDMPDGIDAAALNKVVEANQKAVKSCFDRALKHNAQLGGRLEVALTIGGNGVVSAAEVKTSKHKGELGDCVVAAIKAWKFPRFNGEAITAELPFILSTGN